MTADFGKERDFSKVFASNLLFIPFFNIKSSLAKYTKAPMEVVEERMDG